MHGTSSLHASASWLSNESWTSVSVVDWGRCAVSWRFGSFFVPTFFSSSLFSLSPISISRIYIPCFILIFWSRISVVHFPFLSQKLQSTLFLAPKNARNTIDMPFAGMPQSLASQFEMLSSREKRKHEKTVSMYVNMMNTKICNFPTPWIPQSFRPNWTSNVESKRV